MKYMIYDEEGNALGSFRSRIAAEGALRGMAAAEPEMADDLVLMAYGKDGRLAGRALTVDDLGPPVHMADSPWSLGIAYAGCTARRGGRVNRYDSLVLAGRSHPQLLIRRDPKDEPAPGRAARRPSVSR